MKRILIVVGSSILLVAGVLFWRQQRAQKSPVSITTAPATRKTISATVSSSGKTIAKRKVDLKFQTSGLLTWVGVKEGDTVMAGQVIATLDSREVQKTLEKALRDYSKQRNDFEETWRVTYQGRSKPEQALTDTVKRILEKNQWDLEKSVLDVELKHLSVEFARLASPLNGIVTAIDTPVAGVNITPAGAVFSIVDPTSIVFQANVDETDVGKVTQSMAAVVTLDAYPGREFHGTVSRIAYAAESSSGGATIFPIEVTASDSAALRLGLNGDVKIVTSSIPDVLTVPSEAVKGSGEKYVYQKTGKFYHKVPVTVGTITDTDAEIQAGLAVGDQVVTRGFTDLPK